METTKIKEHIKSGNILPFYIFTGEELKVQDIYIEKLANGKPTQRVDTFLSIAKKLNTSSLLNVAKCYVIRDDIEIMKEEALWDNLSTIIGTNLVIWVFTNIDKRSKFYKHFKDYICEFSHLSEDILLKYVKKEIDLSDKNAKELISICENDYGRILLEIDKIKRFADYCNELPNQLGDNNSYFRCLVEDGTIYTPPRDAIFMWVDALLRKQKVASYGLLQECIEIGEASLTLLSVLYSNTKQVIQVQCCKEMGLNIEKTTGLTSFQIRQALNKCGYYSLNKLVDILKTTQQVEMGIKQGTIPEELAVQLVMVNALN